MKPVNTTCHERHTPVLLRTERAKGRVAVVSGSYGAGHDAAAREIAIRLVEIGYEVAHYDIATILPLRLGRILRWSYFAQLRLSPRSWAMTLRLLGSGTVGNRLVARLLGSASRRLARIAQGDDLVISTHPFAGQAAGHAHEQGWLTVPAVTYLTDASVHPLWVHPGVDLHLAIHEVAAVQARRWGGRTTVVEPLVPRGSLNPASPLASLPRHGNLALVVGGSLGIGDLERTARDIAATGIMTPVVVCGHNTALQSRLGRVPGIVALGWRDDFADLVGASACVIQNAGGFMSLEALSIGTPVLTYRALPGHGSTNAASLEQAGLVPWVRSRDELSDALLRAMCAQRHNRLPQHARSITDVLIGVTHADMSQPEPLSLTAS